MKKELLLKPLALGIVVLFISVSCSSAISVDTKTSVINNQYAENKLYVDPNIHLTRTNLPILKRSFKYFRNSDYYDVEIGKVMEQIISLIEFKGSVNSEDVENILINNDVSSIRIHVFCYIGGESEDGSATVFPLTLLEIISWPLTGLYCGFFIGIGGFLYWKALYSPHITVGFKTYTNEHKGFAFGYFGGGIYYPPLSGYGYCRLIFFPGFALIAFVKT